MEGRGEEDDEEEEDELRRLWVGVEGGVTTRMKD